MVKGQRSQWRWVYDPKSKPGTKPSDPLKREVSEAAEAILAEWRQQYIRPVPKDHQFNYLIAVYTRWRGNYFSFCGTYACPGPNAFSPSFDTCFARLERVRDKRFNLAYMRHTGRWWQTDQALPLSECITKIRENILYHPSYGNRYPASMRRRTCDAPEGVVTGCDSQNGVLLLSCAALSSATPCRFIPAPP